MFWVMSYTFCYTSFIIKSESCFLSFGQISKILKIFCTRVLSPQVIYLGFQIDNLSSNVQMFLFFLVPDAFFNNYSIPMVF